MTGGRAALEFKSKTSSRVEEFTSGRPQLWGGTALLGAPYGDAVMLGRSAVGGRSDVGANEM